MMKKLAIAVVLAAVAIWLIVLLFANNSTRTAVAREWPLGLGRLESVPARYPAQQTNAPARELTRLARAVGVDFEPRGRRAGRADPVAVYVRDQLRRADATIDPPPAWFANNRPGLEAIRRHLLSEQPIAWDMDLQRGAQAPIPSLTAHLRLARLLIANALDRARTGDAGAWEDLRAARALSRSLWRRPEIISALIALTIDRDIIVAARRMPRPAPQWFDEVRTFDHRRAMMSAMQGEAWIIARLIDDEAAADDAGGNWLRRVSDQTVMRPYLVLSRADFLQQQREAAFEISKVTACDFDAQQFAQRQAGRIPWWNSTSRVVTPNLHSAWQRVFRLRAELELTEHVLGLRSGTASSCSDGRWIVEPDRVRFSRPVPPPNPSQPQAAYPLEFRR